MRNNFGSPIDADERATEHRYGSIGDSDLQNLGLSHFISRV